MSPISPIPSPPIPKEDGYLAHLRLEKRLSPETVNAYQSDLRLFFREAAGGLTEVPLRIKPPDR